MVGKGRLAITRTAPSGDETLMPDDAVDVLEELLPARNQSYELGLYEAA